MNTLSGLVVRASKPVVSECEEELNEKSVMFGVPVVLIGRGSA